MDLPYARFKQMLYVAREYEMDRFREAAFSAFSKGVLGNFEKITYPRFLQQLGIPFEEPRADPKEATNRALSKAVKVAQAFRR